METVTVGQGSARTLLVHGNDLCGAFYRPLAEHLAERGLPTALVTLPGFHRVPPLATPSWDGLVELVVQRTPAILIGHSMGGLLALLAAARRPPSLTHLVLLEPAVFPTRWLARAAANRYLGSVVRGDRDRWVNWNGATRRVHDEGAYSRAAIELYLEVRRTSDRATAEALFTALPELYPLPYDRVAVPTLLLTGAETGWRARLMLRSLRRRLRPRHASIPGAAHWMIHEADAALADHIAEFVQ
ncbi:MAG TPA: alpha/beta fold hydrolase [Kofleriaceae bacterium]|nr:alpha/beta fold hydrolase [Kofleriaceae bacterium]